MNRLKNIFAPDHQERLTYEEATALTRDSEYEPSLLKNEFFTFFSNSYEDMIDDITSATGMKVRVPIADSSQLFSLSQILPVLYDHVIFSPAPLHFSPLSSWPEFSKNSLGFGNINISANIFEIINWMGTAKELISDGTITFLPQHGRSLTCWEHNKFDLPGFPESHSLEPFLPEPHMIVEQSCYQLLVETLVSRQLGCDHYLYTLGKTGVSLNGLLGGRDKDVASKRYAFIKLTIPFIKNVELSDLARIRQDEYKHFEALRNSISATIQEIPQAAHSSSRRECTVNGLSKEIIAEPLRQLEEVLTRITKMYLSSSPGCVVASAPIVLCSVAGGDGLSSLVSPIAKAINCRDIYKTFLECLEPQIELNEDSLYYSFLQRNTRLT